MSNKERIIELLDVIPDYKLPYVIGFIQGLLIADVSEVVSFCNDKDKIAEIVYMMLERI